MESIRRPKNTFAKFLYEKDLLQLILAVYLGTVLQDFFNSFVNGVILPFMILLVPNSKYTNFEDIQLQLFGINIAFGSVIMNLIKMFIGFGITFYFVTNFLYKYVKE